MPTDTDLTPEGATQLIDTDYEIGQDNVEAAVGPFAFDIHNPVFVVSGATIVLFTFLTLVFPETAGAFLFWLRPEITSNFDWFFLGAANIFVLTVLGIMISPLGRIRLGGPDATPDYSYAGWFAMLFAAGMGIGLMFFGVSEPISHFSAAVAETAGAPDSWAPLDGAAGDNEAARRLGMAATIFHWGLHPWAIYAVVGLSLALFAYNKGLPLSVRSIFYPIFGERIWGWPGHTIDVLAVFATLFGLATSLGYGAEQANAGLEFLFGIPVSETSKVTLIAGITAVALISVLAGLDAGVKRLSEINLVLAIILLAFVILVGPTLAILSGFVANLGAYATEILPLSNPFGREDNNFRQDWTAFYWAWWISWSPFVGMFIARVSRGRSVREFIFCVLVIPSVVSVLWMTAFGGTAITFVTGGFAAIVDAPTELRLFTMLNELPLAQITSFVGIVLVLVFFVTSSDSGSLVIDTITAGGKVDAPVPQRVFWCLFEGLVAIALLLGGGLAALQAASVSTGLPFAAVLLLGCVALVKGLLSEPRD
jgi:BCCT family betaine/carnitine transporter